MNMLEATRGEMQQLRSEFESGQVKTFKDLIPKLMDIYNKVLPEAMLKAFSSYIIEEKELMTWDKLLYIFEEEVKLVE